MGTYLYLGAGLILLCLVALGLYRFAIIRRKGLPVCVRALPSTSENDWHYGTMVLLEDSLSFFRFVSVWPKPDNHLIRPALSIVSRREASEVEAGFFEPGAYVLTIRQGGLDFPGIAEGDWEIGVTSRQHTALLAWIESAPSVRSQRPSPIGRLRRT